MTEDRISDALRVAAAAAYTYGLARGRHGHPMSDEKQAVRVASDIDEAVRRGMEALAGFEPGSSAARDNPIQNTEGTTEWHNSTEDEQ